MRLLVLGGTLFLGRHLVEAALARGDQVTILHRGQTPSPFGAEVEELLGDRDGDLSVLTGRSWDVAVDTSARLPRWVRESMRVLADTVAHYTFISSVSVYSDTSRPGTDESGPVHKLDDESTEEISDGETYGALKALCEQVAEETMPGRVLSVRAGLIVGPYDDTGRFSYWPHRIARGGDVLVPEPRDQPIQFIHARDLADWILERAAARRAGVFNATGPAEPLTMEQLLDECKAATRSSARLVWVDESFLVERGVEAWSDLPLWVAPDANPDAAGFLSLNVEKALGAGLRFRPLAETIRDTLARADPVSGAGLAAGREAELLEAWKAAR